MNGPPGLKIKVQSRHKSDIHKYEELVNSYWIWYI
jgi:hypothetical protein